MTDLLFVDQLITEFDTDDGSLRAVDQVSFRVKENEVVGLVGESGSGKSVTSLSIMQLVPSPPGNYRGGRILFQGKNLLDLDAAGIRQVRGRDIAMIFQEPMTSLNPVHKIGRQLSEMITTHFPVSQPEAMQRCEEMLRLVGIPEPRNRLNQYPHELSGGMRQRVMIAMALLNRPKLLIADEPTTALDVTIQAQILRLMKELQKSFGMSVLMITHDLGVVAETCDYVCVMYAGQIVEQGPIIDLFTNPAHPYTEGLLRSIPAPLTEMERQERRLSSHAPAANTNRKRPRFPVINGTVPELHRLPAGCRFADRCPYVQDRCRVEIPSETKIPGRRVVRCHFPRIGLASSSQWGAT